MESDEQTDVEPEKVRVNIPRLLLTAAVSALFMVGAGYATYRLTTREPKLVYELTEGPPLKVLGLTRRIYVVTVRNTGRKEVEDFFVGIELSPGRLEDIAASRTPGLQLAEQSDSSSYNARAAFLNPADTLSISFLTSSASTPRPAVTVRGRGVIGRRQRDGTSRPEQTVLLSLLAATIAGTLVPMVLIRLRLRSREPLPGLPYALLPLKRLDRDEPWTVLTYILSKAGMEDMAERVRYGERATPSYREVADRLIGYSAKGTEERTKAIAVLAALSRVPWISSASRDVVLRSLRILHAPETVTDIKKLSRGISPVELRDEMDSIISSLLT